MLKQSAEMAGGTFGIESEVGKGTCIHASFDLTNIDCIPMGDICDSLMTLIVLNPETPDFVFRATAPGKEALFDTRQVREALGGVGLADRRWSPGSRKASTKNSNRFWRCPDL